jgi:RNA polymerase sigma-70 factor (ECF subfamily)
MLPRVWEYGLLLAWSMLGNKAAAEDAAQEVFIRVWKALPGFRGQASLSTWIYAVARNVCLTALRAAALRQTISIDEPDVLRAVERRRDSGAARGAEPDLERLLSELPEKQRQAITLFYLEDKSYQEVASLLGWPMGTVKTHLHRARKQLASAMVRATVTERDR